MLTGTASLTWGLIALLAACAPTPSTGTPPRLAAPPSAHVDATMLDRSVDPCDDLYQYACGGWLKTARIPEGQSNITSFQPLIDANRAVLREIVDDAVRAAAGSSPETRRVGDFYASCLAAEQADPGADAALAAELATIAAVHDARTLAVAVARSQLLRGGIRSWWSGIGTLFSLSTDYDLHDGSLVVAQLDQGGLALPDASFYLEAGAKAEALRASYHDHVARMLALTGSEAASARRGADAVMHLETELARASVSDQHRRDPAKIDHRMTRAQVASMAPHIDWDAYFAALGVPDLDAINVMVPEYYRVLDRLVAASSIADLRAYVRWHLLDALGTALPGPLAAEHLAFQATLTGTSGVRPRADECLDVTDAALGWAIGASFTRRRFPAAAQRRADALVDGIIAAFDADLDRASWLDAATRRAAKVKLRAVHLKIGMPAHPRSYDALGELDRASYLRNRIATAVFEASHWLHRAGTHPPADEWLMRPQTFDAYYDVARNEMVFPAAILQPPFFYPEGGDSERGNIGWVMGHELSHGYDSLGRKFDETGAMRTWWSPSAEKEYEARVACVARQYDAYEALPGVHVDGRRTLGENIADLGGARLSYEAYRAARGGEDDADQAFFVSRAQSNCELATEEAMRIEAKSDVHAPSRFRINGPFANLPAFAAAFHCPAGKPMAPVERCSIW